MSNQSLNIRVGNLEDFQKLAEIWFEASIIAHDFIPVDYWEKNKIKMQTQYLPMSEVYVAEFQQDMCGFIALLGNKIAAIFVFPQQQGKGIGRALLGHAKKLKTQLELNVYQQNSNSVEFYHSNGFKILGESLDSETHSKEFIMLWE